MNNTPLRNLTKREIHEQLYPGGRCTCGCVRDLQRPYSRKTGFKIDTSHRASCRLWAAKRDAREAVLEMGLAELAGDNILYGMAAYRHSRAMKRIKEASNRLMTFRSLR